MVRHNPDGKLQLKDGICDRVMTATEDKNWVPLQLHTMLWSDRKGGTILLLRFSLNL
jgi:hypothetical protein